jgi:hypothetical protein
MKWMLFVVGIFLQTLVTNAAVTVNFSSYPDPAVPIDGTDSTVAVYTDSDPTVALGYVYIRGGSSDTTSVGQTGVVGSLATSSSFGTLYLLFPSATASLTIDYNLQDSLGHPMSGLISPALTLGLNDNSPNTSVNYATSSGSGSVTYNSAFSGGFTSASLDFDLAASGASFFEVTGISFTAVPEPTAMAVCFGLGLCGYAGWRRVRRQGC